MTMILSMPTPMLSPLNRLCDAELPLHVFEGDALGLRIVEQDDEEHYQHHGREKGKRSAARVSRNRRESVRNGGIHDPMRQRAKTLALRSNPVRKHFADVDPDDCALRKSEARDEAHEQPDQERLMRI